MAKERIGILGGTFNPIHEGHIAMARAALQNAHLDRVLILPDGTPPHKTGIADAEDRWRMVSVAVVHEKGLEASRLELDREGTTYTYDTLKALTKAYPRADLFYIIGTDTLMELHTWFRSDDVLHMCTFLVCPRRTDHAPEEILQERKRLTALGARFQSVDMPIYNVSSTDIRKALSDGTASQLLPVPVLEYCRVAALYGLPQRFRQGREWLAMLFHDLTVKRFAHTLCVAHTAVYLARVHHLDDRKAEIAALLHDCAKCMPMKKMQKICREHALTNDVTMIESGALLHAIAGAYQAASVYGIEDPDILRAISCHTTGKIGMTDLDMVVYLADKIEPTRNAYPALSKVRMLAPLSLPKAMLYSIESTQAFVKSSSKPLHPQSIRTAEWLKTLPEVRER